MSIHFISGKPGGGKSLYGVRMILDELGCGNRPIVTNIPLRLDVLNDYLQKRFPKSWERRFGSPPGEMVGDEASILKIHERHISEVITVLQDEELPTFFTHRGHGVTLEGVSNAEWKTGKRPDFSTVKDGGVFYVLDEVHIAFGARQWALTGQEVLYYLSQHRKLGDDVICITQAIANVDKQFRSVAQDFTYIRNLSKQKVGLFRLPAIFLRSTYAQPSTDNSVAMETGTFKLDVSGVAACYDTSKGVGIHGRKGADTKERKRGIHWLWFMIIVPVVCYLIFAQSPKLIAKLFTGGGGRSASVVQSGPGVVSNVGGVHSNSVASTQTTNLPADEVYCTGYTILGGVVHVTLSDGRVADSRDGDVELVGRKAVVVFGKSFSVHRAPDIIDERVGNGAIGDVTSVGGSVLGSGNRGARGASSVTVIGSREPGKRLPPLRGAASQMQSGRSR